MKIKELHLRNIASIEAVDIDFVNDMTEPVTGSPTPVFLISGDTGAGKSIILDGISMALYKTTPRLRGVSNKSTNAFCSSSGEEIRVSSITQYTRIGISADDESYSELVFEGNDGITYTARLTLGMRPVNRNGGAGPLLLKHRAPNWTLRFDRNELTNVDDIKAAVQNAVGLSFEQFHRMAMLAQGQFASFLVGEKKERESILEKLTNTEHFSEFGKAIKSLFDRAKAELVLKTTLFDTEMQHSIPDEELAELRERKAHGEAVRKDLEAQLKAIRETIDQVKLIEASRKSLEEASKQKAELDAARAGDDYRQSVALVNDWKATEDQRRCLSDMRKAVGAKNRVSESEGRLRDSFTGLSADLAFRNAEVEKKKQAIAELEAWLVSRSSRDSLYAEAPAVAVKINNFIQTVNDIAENTRKSEEEKGRSAGLRQALEDAKQKALSAAEAVNAKQRQIDELSGQRRQLQPEETNRLLSEANERERLLSGIKSDLANISEDSKKAAELEQQTREGAYALAGLEKTMNEAQASKDSAEKQYEKSRDLCSAMEMSLDEKIVALRHRLASEHAETCPLCGQSLGGAILDLDFDEVLHPLRKLQHEAKGKYENAKSLLNGASKEYNRANGVLSTQRKSYENAVAELQRRNDALNRKAASAGLDCARDLGAQLAEASGSLEARIKDLKAQQQKALELQNQIEKLVREKAPLDKAKTQADREESAAGKALDRNSDQLKSLAESAAKLSASRDKLKNEISAALADAFLEWTADAAAAREQLLADAREYIGQKNALAENKAACDVSQREIENIESQCQAVREIHGDWNASPRSCRSDSSDILREWRRLVADVQHAAATIEGHDKTIRECAGALNSYYGQSGKSEKDLDAIQGRAGEIESRQDHIQRIEKELKSREDAIADALRKIAESKARLGVEDDDDVPALEKLEEESAGLSARKDREVGELSSIETRLKEDASNKDKLEKARAALEAARNVHAKWDKLNDLFGGTRMRTLVQSYILRPLLVNANIYLERITDRYTLTCSSENEQLAILVLDRYSKNEVRSATLLSGGERFMISLALSLALSSLNRPDMNVDILFIDEGFGTLDEKTLESVMYTLERLQEIAGESQRRVGIISHREELNERIPSQIEVLKKGEGRSQVRIK